MQILFSALSASGLFGGLLNLIYDRYPVGNLGDVLVCIVSGGIEKGLQLLVEAPFLQVLCGILENSIIYIPALHFLTLHSCQ